MRQSQIDFDICKSMEAKAKKFENASKVNVKRQNVKKPIVKTRFSVPFGIKDEQHSPKL